MSRPTSFPIVSRERAFRREWLLLPLLLLGVAVVLVIAFAAQLVITAEMPWADALGESFGWWVVPFSVLAIGAALTYVAPLEKRRWRWALPVHLVACVAVVTLAGEIEAHRMASARASRMEARPPRERPREDQPPPPELSPPEARRPRGPASGGVGGGRRFFFSLFASSRWQLFLAVYGVSVSVASAWRMRQHAVERERKTLELTASLSQAKLEALRLQLQPHFLFNTLNAIATLVHRDANAADEMITNLGDLLRLVLEATESEVPLRRELELVDRYLAIEAVRLGERLRVERVIAPGVLDAAVPPLMLQTLVENAVRHGIEPRRAPGTIVVRAERLGARLRIIVGDDGVGLPAATAGTEKRGVGLANSEARLHELYGAAARLELRAPPEGGTHVEIELPWRSIGPTASPHPTAAGMTS